MTPSPEPLGVIAGSGRRLVVAVILIGAATLPFTGGCRRQPERPLELNLSVVKTRIRAHEALWYVLDLKNIGLTPIVVFDDYWRDQHFLGLNMDRHLDTFLEILGPDGKPLKVNYGWLGFHGEFDFWTNPPSQTPLSIGPGQSLKTSPSIVAPIRNGPHSDFRKSPDAAQQGRWLSKLQKQAAEGNASSWPEWARVPSVRPPWAPPNARILTGFDFTMPGRYRIRAVYEPIRTKWAEEEIRLRRFLFSGLPKETRVFRYESPWIEIEVVP